MDLLVELLVEDDETFEADATTVVADPRLVRIAVGNLVENARIHGGGVERVRVAGGVVEVLDRGPGVHDPRLLAPFTKGAASKGTGLGLALVARIAEAHGGRLELGKTTSTDDDGPSGSDPPPPDDGPRYARDFGTSHPPRQSRTALRTPKAAPVRRDRPRTAGVRRSGAGKPNGP